MHPFLLTYCQKGLFARDARKDPVVPCVADRLHRMNNVRIHEPSHICLDTVSLPSLAKSLLYSPDYIVARNWQIERPSNNEFLQERILAFGINTESLRLPLEGFTRHRLSVFSCQSSLIPFEAAFYLQDARGPS